MFCPECCPKLPPIAAPSIDGGAGELPKVSAKTLVGLGVLLGLVIGAAMASAPRPRHMILIRRADDELPQHPEDN